MRGMHTDLHPGATRSPQRSTGEHLRELRSRQRVSQLELSLRVGVSQRHLSCVETGRARASREMLLAILDALDAPLTERNQALLAAGFAPAYGARRLDQPDLAPVRLAIGHLLTVHEPAPALVIDSHWTVVQANRGVHALLRLLGVDPAVLSQDFNLLRALLRPDGLRAALSNPVEVCASVWQRAEREAVHAPELRPLLDELRAFVPRQAFSMKADAPMLFTRVATSVGELSFFSAFTTFGSPLDVTIASLRIEHLFPADDATRVAMQEALAG